MRALPVTMIAITAAACAHHRQTYVAVAEVHEHLMALRQQGHARVDATETDRDFGNAITSMADDRRTVTLTLDRTVELDGRQYTLRELADGCPDRPPAPIEGLARPCGLFIYRDSRFLVGERAEWTSNSYTALITGLAGLAAGGGAIYCGSACDDWPRAKAAGLGVGSFVLLIASALYSGGRD